jgi:hypothetical protein
MRAWSRVFVASAVALVTLVLWAIGSLMWRAPLPPTDTRVIPTLGEEQAIWRFIPMDVLPGAAEVEADLPPPP